MIKKKNKNMIVKQRNCLDLRKYFSARVVGRANRLDQEDIDRKTVNGFQVNWKRNAT